MPILARLPYKLSSKAEGRRGGAGTGHTIDAVYGAIYDDSTFLFQPQWDRRNLNLLHIRCKSVSVGGGE